MNVSNETKCNWRNRLSYLFRSSSVFHHICGHRNENGHHSIMPIRPSYRTKSLSTVSDGLVGSGIDLTLPVLVNSSFFWSMLFRWRRGWPVRSKIHSVYHHRISVTGQCSNKILHWRRTLRLEWIDHLRSPYQSRGLGSNHSTRWSSLGQYLLRLRYRSSFTLLIALNPDFSLCAGWSSESYLHRRESSRSTLSLE